MHQNTDTMNTSKTHEPDTVCNICKETMGVHNPVTSMQTVCCANTDEWYHKLCFKKKAVELEDDFQCPTCSDYADFRDNMLANGIYIPKSRAVALYRSFDDSVEEPPQKKKRIHKEWILEKAFSSKAEADQFLVDENWGYQYSNKSDNGVRINYRCKLVKFRGNQCDAAIALLFDSRSEKIQLFRADSPHTHENIPTAVEKIPIDVQAAIKDLYENNVTKPKAISINLLKKGFEVPPSAKLKTFLKKLNDEKFGADKLDSGTLEKWLKETSNVPDSDIEPFILNYEMIYGNELEFRFIVTSKLLLKLAIDAKNVHTDATYKLIWQNFPVLATGFTDLCRKFHPTVLAVCVTEQKKDFKFIFESTKKGIREIFDADYEPEYLIADAAGAIQNGAKEVWPLIEVIMCWFHMYKNVSDKVPTFLKELGKQSEFLADLQKLQVAKSKEIFNVAVHLFMEKWRQESVDLVNYFETQWVLKNSGWYESFASPMPSTNNALESTNRVIKDEGTMRERLDLSKFRTIIFDIVRNWSMEYTAGLKLVTLNAPEIPLALWTKGYHFAKANSKITSSRRGAAIIYRCAEIEKIDDAIDWNNFDVFKKKSFEFHDTQFIYPINRENWLKSKCDCCDYFKLYICAHIIGIAIRLKIVIAPAEAKSLPIGQKRKRGRPAKAKSALVRQES